MVWQAVPLQREQGSLWKQAGLPTSLQGSNWKGESSLNLLVNSPDSLLASFRSKVSPGQLTLIAGPSGSGKTSWCLRLANAAVTLQIQPRGLISPAVFLDENKIAIDLVDLVSGENRRLAVRRGNTSSIETTPSVYAMQDWLIDPLVISWGNQILSKLSIKNKLLILDELGPLELLEDTGLTAGLELINSRTYRMACVVVRSGLVQNALERWPWAMVIDINNQAARLNGDDLNT
jgi:nucleoside-triphosphatase THEP1